MNRIFACKQVWFATLVAVCLLGCRNRQVAHVLKESDKDMVGSHKAGAETYDGLVEQACAALFSRQFEGESADVARASFVEPRRVCFVGITNKSAEEMGDFKAQLNEQIEMLITQHPALEPISHHYIEAGLNLARLRPEDLFVPANMREFSSIMEQSGQPIDYLMFATLTSGTTQSNSNYQRDYKLTLEMVNVQTGRVDKEQAEIRKAYHKTRAAKWLQYNPFTR